MTHPTFLCGHPTDVDNWDILGLDRYTHGCRTETGPPWLVGKELLTKSTLSVPQERAEKLDSMHLINMCRKSCYMEICIAKVSTSITLITIAS
jgi:hypothetical protein